MMPVDDPFGPRGRTVIRPDPGRAPKKAAGPAGPDASEPAEATRLDAGSLRPPSPPEGSGTIIYQHLPFAEEGQGPAEDAPQDGGREGVEGIVEAYAGVEYPAANAILAAAAPLLLLLGDLRAKPVETEFAALAEPLSRSIQAVEDRMRQASVPEEDIRIAKYVLCETVDDILGHLPGLGGQAWLEQGMLVRFFQAKVHGVGFFQAVNTVLSAPDKRYDLLELMHACLSLGFEGQYRGAARRQDGLERARSDIHQTLRYLRPETGKAISPQWQAAAATPEKRAMRLSLWAVAVLAAALVAGAFFALQTQLTKEADALDRDLLALNPAAPVVLQRQDDVPPVEEAKPAATQLDRLRSELATEIQGGSLSVGTKGAFILIEISNQALFEAGKAELKPDFDAVAADIATALAPERGAIKVVGHTDNAKPRKGSAFKSNHDLSVARAEAVAKAIVAKLGDPARVTAEGKGEDEPVADNATPEGRARNRRVEVMIPQEETL